MLIYWHRQIIEKGIGIIKVQIYMDTNGINRNWKYGCLCGDAKIDTIRSRYNKTENKLNRITY